MATRLINNLGEGGPSSFVISVGSWVVHTCISVKLFKTKILEACWRKLWDNEYGYFLYGLQLYKSTEDRIYLSRLHIVTPSGDYRYTLVGYPSL